VQGDSHKLKALDRECKQLDLVGILTHELVVLVGLNKEKSKLDFSFRNLLSITNTKIV